MQYSIHMYIVLCYVLYGMLLIYLQPTSNPRRIWVYPEPKDYSLVLDLDFESTWGKTQGSELVLHLQSSSSYTFSSSVNTLGYEDGPSPSPKANAHTHTPSWAEWREHLEQSDWWHGWRGERRSARLWQARHQSTRESFYLHAILTFELPSFLRSIIMALFSHALFRQKLT
jgi:hypothetical protein